MRWAGQVARMGKEEVRTGFCRGNMRNGDHLEDPAIDGWIKLK